MDAADSKTWLIAKARLHDYVWIVDKCPHCGRHHMHPAGGPGENAKTFLGHQTTSCHPDGYILVDASAMA